MRPSPYIFTAVAAVCVTASPFAYGQNAPVTAPIVKSIDIQFAGPATVSRERILANMRTQIGRPYSETAVSEDIRNIYSTGNISNVRIFGEPQGDGVRVIVVVQSKAAVKEVRLEGFTHVKLRAIRKLLVTKAGDRLTEANLETDRQKILEKYQDEGYKDTSVQYRIETEPKTENSIVTFTVTEGGKTVIQHIKFEGNTAFKASELRKLLKTKTHNFFLSVFTKAGRLQNEVLEEDVASIREFYQNHGYLDVQVNEPQIERVDQKADVNLVFTIKEGRVYHLGRVSVAGEHLFTADEIMAAVKLKSGAIYSPKAVADSTKAIQDLYGARGYIDAQVVAESTPAGGDINDLSFRIDEGTQFYIERINISGNTRTKDKVIRRELAVAPGDVYNSVRVEASKGRLQNLNYFEDRTGVSTYPSDSGIPGKKDLNVVVTEKRTGSLNFGAGFSTIDKLLGFVELTQSNFDVTNWPNLTGGGQRFRTRIQYGTTRKDFIVSLTEPYFLDYQFAVGGELFYHDASFLSAVYNQKNYGFNLFARKAINEFVSVRLDYKLEDIKIYGLDSRYKTNTLQAVTSPLHNAEGDFVRSQVGPTLTYDTRDSLFLTRKGDRVELSSYVSGLGGDIKIYGADLEASHYISLPWDTILTLNGELATVHGLGSGDVKVFDRLYLGGANNLRGFRFRDVGPKDLYGEPVGGQTLARATVEYTYPIVDRVRGAVFYDVGILNAGAYDFSTSNLASDAGLGLRLDLPIGPIRLDLGFPLQPTAKSSGHFNFNIGYQF